MSEIHTQLALPFARAAGSGASAIIVGSGNARAVDALSDPSCWPYGTAILSGPARSGKSLLAEWFAANDAGTAVVIDDADAMDETALFHRWNAAREAGASFLMTVADSEWVVSLPDLRSRLSAALMISIEQPDDAMMLELLEKHAATRRLPLSVGGGAGAAQYLIPRIDRSYAAVEEVVGTIDRISLERKTAPTQAIWRAAIAAMQNPDHERSGGDEQPRLI